MLQASNDLSCYENKFELNTGELFSLTKWMTICWTLHFQTVKMLFTLDLLKMCLTPVTRTYLSYQKNNCCCHSSICKSGCRFINKDGCNCDLILRPILKTELTISTWLFYEHGRTPSAAAKTIFGRTTV
jgi:hypothetical protein